MRRQANLWRGAILSPIPGEGGLQPIVCCQPARSREGGFSGCVARLFFWLCRQVVFLAVSPGCFSGCVARLFFWLFRQVVFLAVSPGYFSGCVARLFFWLCRQVIFLAVSPGCFSGCVARLLTVSSGCFSGCVARFVTDCIVRWFLAGFARVRFLTFVSGVIAQDRAS